MWFWIIAAGMTAAVAFALARPLLKGRGAPADRRAFDFEVYRNQLAELERDVERGLISPQQAASARAEIGRRVLALGVAAPEAANAAGATVNAAGAPANADPAPDSAMDSGTPSAASSETAAGRSPAAVASRANKIAAGLLVAMIPVGALVIYLPLGRPDLPARPLASRNIDKERNAPPPAVLAAVEKLRAELLKNPDNLQGWSILARTLSRMSEWGEAAGALRNVLRLSPDDVDAKAAYAEALINDDDGAVGAEAIKLLNEVKAALPQDPRPAYYLALARSRTGDLKGALEDWRAQAAATPADAPWLPLLKTRIEETASKLGIDVASAMPEPLPPAQPQQPAAPGDAPGVAGEQQAMIAGMVRRLEDRLKENPDDVDGWVRLARSYRVTGRSDEALNAAREAVKRGPRQAAAHLALADALLGGTGREEIPSPLPADVDQALRTALELDATNRDALWLLGSDAARQGRPQDAARFWGRLLAQLDAGSSDYAFVKERLDGLK